MNRTLNTLLLGLPLLLFGFSPNGGDYGKALSFQGQRGISTECYFLLKEDVRSNILSHLDASGFGSQNLQECYAFLATEICDNGLDDDGDGLTDCNDADCNPNVNFVVNQPTCSGGSVGSIDLTVSGSTAPYSYLWGDMLPEARWNFENNTNDVSGNGHHRTGLLPTISPVGVESYSNTDFKEGKYSFNFNGGTMLRFGVDGGFLETAFSARTYSLWVKPANLTGIKVLFEQGGSTSGLAARLNGNVLTAAYRASNTQYTTGSLTFPADGAWHHVAVVFNNGTLTCYLDGVASTNATSTNTTIPANAGDDGVGGRNSTDAFAHSASNYFSGKMDDFRIFYSALPASRIADIARNDGDRTSLATGNYNVTVTGSIGCSSVRSFTVNADNNITNGGTIGADEVSCNNFNPTIMVSFSDPIGGSGTIQYIWQKSTNGGATWSTINNATASSYDPPTISETTQYRRGARRTTCTPYVYSNIVTKTPASCLENCGNNMDDDGDGLIDDEDPDCGGNIMTVIPAGSYIINMSVQPQTANNALKPYGLVWHLLHYFETPVMWSIDPEKNKDGEDFKYNGVKYKGGPFIVSAEYRTPSVDSLISAWEAKGVVGITTTSEFTAPINRTLNYSMNWTLNSVNDGIVENYLTRAGIPETGYDWTAPHELNCCNDVFLMPHSEPEWSTHNRLYSWNDSEANGGCAGALWAGCKAGSTVENIFNPANPAQRMNFLMLDPIAPLNNPAVHDGDHEDGTIPPPYSYGFPAHPVMQFMGTMDGAQEGGAEQIYLPTNDWRPTTYVGLWDATHPDVPLKSPGPAAKMAFGPAFGDPNRGYIMYEAGHRVDGSDLPANIAAQRAFFNFAFLAVGHKAIKANANIPEEMESGVAYDLTASATGGSGVYNFHWETTCGGTFSNPHSANTSFTPPNVLTFSECYIKVTVTDDCGTRVGFQNIYLRLRPRPMPPVAVNDYEQTNPGEAVTVNALANDSDPNMDPLVLKLLGNPNTGNGVFVNNGNGSVTYTSRYDFEGVDQINYEICDNTSAAKGGPLCDTATIFITVDWSDANGCLPNQYYGLEVLGNATSVIAQNSIGNPTQALGAPVLVVNNNAYYAKIDNDGDYLVLDLGYNVPIGDTIWLHIGTDDGSAGTLQVRGSLTGTNYATGSDFYDLRTFATTKDLDNAVPLEDVVAYVPTTAAVRKLRFNRSAGAGKPSINGVRYINWDCLSAVPVANDDVAILCEDNTVIIEVLANDSDPEDLPLSIDILTPPSNGIAVVLPDGTVRYKPNADYSGPDNFTYQACNPRNLCDPATVNITINDDFCPPGYYKISVAGACSGNCILSPNNPPDAINDFATTPLNTPVSIAVQSNDLDPSGLGLTTYLGYANPPDNGTVALDGNNIRYTPNNGFIGLDTFNYKICNVYGCDSALVIVDVLCADPQGGRAIQGFVFNDADGSTTLNTDEIGISNVRVNLYKDTNSNGTLDAGETKIDSTLTDNFGNYVFRLENGAISSASSQTYYATVASGSVDNGYPISNATGAPNGSFVKLNSGKYVILQFANTIPTGSIVSIYLASDKKTGKADVTSSFDGVTYGNLSTWQPSYANDQGSPPPASAIQVFTYQVTAASGTKFIKIARTSNNIYVDAASWKESTVIGSGGSYTISRSISSATDDAEEEGPDGSNLGAGGMYLNSTDLEIVQDLESPSSGTQKIGLRFNSLNIPAGATITSATLRFKAITADSPNTNTGVTSLTIKGQAADNATTFESTTNNISNRALTTASTTWNPSSWVNGTAYTSPDLSAVVQEIIGRPGWANGNSLAFVITGTGSRSAISYDGSPAGAPVLEITYDLPSAATTSLPATEDAEIWTGSGGTTDNYGNCNILYFNGAPTQRSLIKFNLSNIPDNATIISASLRMVKIGGSNTPTYFSAHKITNNWTEGTGTCAGTSGVCNWNQRQTGINWTTAGGDFDAAAEATYLVSGNGVYNWNIPGMVQSWVTSPSANYGVLLKFVSEAGVNNEMEFASSENATIANRPQLEVVYTIPALNNHYVLQLNPTTLPQNATLTTDNYEAAVILNNGEVDCANNFGIITHLPPVALPDTAYADAGVAIQIPILNNDYDPEGTPLSVTLLTNPPYGTAVNNGSGVLTFTSNVGFTGWQTFLYKICDAGTPSLCDTTTVSVLVQPLVNRAPVAMDDYDTTFVNIPIETDVTANDFDPQFDEMSVSLSPGILQPANGTVEVISKNEIEYTPNPGFTGDDVYQYIVCDNRTPARCDTAKVFIHVKNNPPIARPDFMLGQVNTPLQIPVLINDFDLDGHAVVLMSAGTNATPNNGQTKKGGTVTVNTNGTPSNFADDFVNYIPAPGFNGLDTFYYRVRDTGLPNGYDITWVEVRITGLIDLELTKSVNPAVSGVNQNVTFTLTLLNKGPANATGVRVKDKLTNSYQYVSDNAGGMYDPVSGVWYVPAIAVNQTRTLTITAKVLNAANTKNVTEVIAADQKDVDSTPDNDDGDQSEDDEDAATPTLVEICGNGNDDDGDGYADCADADCSGVPNAGPDAVVCSGSSATLTATATGPFSPYTITWSHSLGSGATKSVTPIATTTYTVTITGSNGCTATDQVVVTVSPRPTVTAGASQTICNGTSATLTVSATGGASPYTFAWSNGLGAGASKTVTPSSTTTYTVTATDSYGCTATAQTSVVVSAVPIANAGPDIAICDGNATFLSATGAGAPSPFTYNWSNGVSGASQTVSPAATTTYTVTVTSANGCFATDSKLVTVQECVEICNNGIDDDGNGQTDCADAVCGPTANAGTDISICPGNSALLSVGVTGGTAPYTYAWSHGLGAGVTKWVSPTVTTTYTVTVTSASGCTTTDQVSVIVMACSEDCTNGIDDDGDGLVDCDDPNCTGVTAPVLVDDNYTTCPGMTYSERVTYNDGNLNNPVFSIATMPTHGTVTIDWTGKFTYIPNSFLCVTDQFTYQVCNQTTGCCDVATVTIVLGDNTPPLLTNVPADLTISCDDAVPDAPVVTVFDNCAGVFIDFDETSSQNYVGACGSYTITRTWQATDFCGNTTTDDQKITVVDQTKPEIFQVYTLEDGAKMVAGFAQRVTHDWKYVRFPIIFKTAPVILITPSTNVDATPVVAKVRNISTQGFEMRLREEESLDGLHGLESVSWVAVEATAQTAGFKMEAGTMANVNENLNTINFANSYSSEPIFFSAFNSDKQTDPATLRHTSLTGSNVQLFAQEEQSADTEVSRLNETVGYMTIEPGSALVDANGNVFGEAGKMNVTNAWATVNLTNRYTKPVVIIGGVTNKDAQPLTLRVRNITTGKFEVRLQEWNYLDGNHPAENISWMVVEGSIPANRDFYCDGNADKLQENISIFALDNCDDLVAFDYTEFSNINNASMVSSHTWTAIDDCGNTTLLNRLDTCFVAAVKVKAGLYGPITNNGGGSLMRDDLRSQDLVPIVEPYSELPGYPYVDNVGATVTICHHTGQADQQTMDISVADLEDHLSHGDVLGTCGLPPASLPSGAANVQFRTIANGLWTSASTWQGGQIPPTGNIAGKSISIEHHVELPNANLDFKSNSKLYITNGGLKVTNGSIGMNNGSLIATNAKIEVTGDIYTWASSDLLEIKNSEVVVGGSFENDKGIRKLNNVCLSIYNSYTTRSSNAIDTLKDVTMNVGAVVRIYNGSKLYAKDTKIRLANGNFIVEGTSLVDGNGLTLLLENGNVANLANTWTAVLDKYCVAGTHSIPAQYLPAVEECSNITNLFQSCDPDNILISTGNGGGSGGGGTSNGDDQVYRASSGVIAPAVLDVTGPSAVVDWLLVELRNPDNLAQVLGYSTVMMNRDGRVFTEEGDSVIIFKGLPEEEYVVSVRHRNHLGLMTEFPVFLTISNPPLIDFTNPTTPVKGNSAGRIFNGKRLMWGGDYNGDGRIIYQGPNNDVFYLFSKVLGAAENTTNLANFIIVGYEMHDFNLDGKVIYQGPNNDRAPLLYNTILSHAGNGSFLANYIVMDFIP